MSITTMNCRHFGCLTKSSHGLAVADEYRFDDPGLEQLAADIDFDFIADGDAQRQAGEGDGLL